LHGAVKLIGTSIEASKHKCEFALLAASAVEGINKILFVQGYSEEWETSFKSGKCLCRDEIILPSFLIQNKPNLYIILSKVK
jgi:hypothetical protein